MNRAIQSFMTPDNKNFRSISGYAVTYVTTKNIRVIYSFICV